MIDSNKQFVDDSLALLHRSGISLSTPSEYELFVAYKTELDEDARLALRDKLARANIRYVISLARGYSNNPEILNDLVGCGNMGLLDSIDRFDPYSGVKFISFAVWHIKKYMLDYMYDNALIYVPRDKLIRMRKELKDHPDNPDIEHGVLSARNVVSLDAAIDTDDQCGGSLIDIIVDNNQLNEHESTISNEHNRWIIDNIMSELEPTELDIIDRVYGLSDGVMMSDGDIANDGKTNICRERVRQIRVAALKKLKLKYNKHTRSA